MPANLVEEANVNDTATDEVEDVMVIWSIAGTVETALVGANDGAALK